MAIEMTYGNYIFKPVPMISVSKTYHKSNNDISIGAILDLRLNGNLVVTSGNGGLPLIMSGVRELRQAFNQDGKLFEIKCDGNLIFAGYPRIKENVVFEESQNNWIFTCPYSLTLEFDFDTSYNEDSNVAPPYVEGYQDEWSFEFDDSNSYYTLPTSVGIDTGTIIIRATHNISAVGKTHYDGPGIIGNVNKPAWQQAKDFVFSKVINNPVPALVSGLLGLATPNWSGYNHFRTQNINESEGSFAINDSFVIINKTNYGVIETFNAEIVSNINNPFVTVTINGSIQGLESRSYGSGTGTFTVHKSKFANASGYFETIRDNLLIYPRAQALAAKENVVLNVIPINKIVGKSPPQGTITYSYEYDSRPSNCITGSRIENIQISDENPNDVFAKITLMGRSQGPILQSLNTVTEFRRNVNIDVIMNPVTGCNINILTSGNNPEDQINSILCNIENDLKTKYSHVLKERDNSSWEPRTGRYSRSVTWCAVDCYLAPNTSFC